MANNILDRTVATGEILDEAAARCRGEPPLR